MYNDSIYDQKQFDKFLKTFLQGVKPGYKPTPTIFHKQVMGDSVINYFAINMSKADGQFDPKSIKIVYEQDPLYLILNKKLPEFKLKDLNDKLFNSAYLVGKPSLINFWSIQCAPCIEEFAELDKLKNKYGDNVNFISISENSKSQVLELLKRKPFNYNHLVDGYSYKTTLKIGSIPKNIFLDKNGHVFEIKGGIPYELDRSGKPFIARYQFEKILDKLTKL
jgi:thiol-disulfide isomerase/thioredoxin